MHQSKGPDDRAAVTRITGVGQELVDDYERFRLGAPVRFDEGARGRAKSGAADRIGDEIQQLALEIAIRGDLDGGAVGEKFLGDLLEILHVRPEDDRVAE